MAFDDIYPEGHQGGVSLIMQGNRIATNDDIRLEPTPKQWQAVPKQHNRITNQNKNKITTYLSFPDSSYHITGFNPMAYPDMQINYTLNVEGKRNSVIVTVDLEWRIPQNYIGKVVLIWNFFQKHYSESRG